MKKNIFESLSLFIEKYYLETFALEALIVIVLLPSVRSLAAMVVSLLITVTVAEGLKMVIREKRPKKALERQGRNTLFGLNLRSFPSAHAAVAFMFVGLTFESALFMPLLVFGVVVAYGRVYIKSHFIHDVIAGGALGFIIGYGVAYSILSMVF